ncbi:MULTISPECIES: LLM class flavin-dependent oxidoreductase [Pseudonocardia]|uniref:Nitrilotriacetate monooxygenase component A n=2 Tax=Pseudonocardia TaxID=1847 RepID=A0A1Y2MRH1_PSEAH|nr:MULTISPECIES: LLM class flavin-dependent oxidoreductase [Pseudonocardia]OSY37824.1 Nitrilotriacetate monooxygenase component A [Pseudonocardia autotrophica]TDN72513.1 alkanesulfonate monooxygenase SsuD/methylene tetrahydromethanopterin reductase-like flavin-dependent oxidoreductase (luciferase family) [Pseudonocardia autotrophica]BBG03222.1 FMNH2-utilizing oxygenase [Pseudonocardia autotrophica]GEC23839.1 FMNH2-utilizing oxygenase [Pseudonocardia saturnea]
MSAPDTSVPPASPLHLAVAFDGTGWHPAAWREPGTRPGELFTARHWVQLARTAERGLLDLITIEDGLGLQSGDHLAEPERRTDRVQGRLDASLVAAFLAPLTSRIGLVPTVTTTHTEPFHVASALATLDHDSHGRAGWRVQTSVRADEAAHFGRRQIPAVGRSELDTPRGRALVAELFGEAAEVVDTVRRLWDSWEDGAEIRDALTGRFVDRDRLHTVDVEAAHFAVRGPSIVPRPPQGQPLVASLSHGYEPSLLAARVGDVVFTTPHDADDAARVVDQVRTAERAAGRTAPPLRILADLVVVLAGTEAGARDRLARLDARDPLSSDALVVATTPAGLADRLLDWRAAGLDGYRLRPAVLPTDLDAIVDGLVPELQRRGAFRTGYAETGLRERFGLPRPTSRYAPRSGSATVPALLPGLAPVPAPTTTGSPA